MSVSHQTTMSPRRTWRLFHSASPLPVKLPCSRRTSACCSTGTPSDRAISTVRSVEPLSITTISSSSGEPSSRALRRVVMMSPIVASSFSVGRPRLIVRPWRRFSSTRRPTSRNSREWKVFSANHLSTSEEMSWPPVRIAGGAGSSPMIGGMARPLLARITVPGRESTVLASREPTGTDERAASA